MEMEPIVSPRPGASQLSILLEHDCVYFPTRKRRRRRKP